MQLGFMFGAAAEEQHYIEVLRPSSLFCPSIRPFVSFPCRQTQLHSKFIVFIYNWQKSNLLLLFQGNFGPTIRYRFSPCLEIIATRLIHRLIQCMSVVLRFSCSVACSPSWGVYFDLIITRSRKLRFEIWTEKVEKCIARDVKSVYVTAGMGFWTSRFIKDRLNICHCHFSVQDKRVSYGWRRNILRMLESNSEQLLHHLHQPNRLLWL